MNWLAIIQEKIDWFLEKSKANQVGILLIIIIGCLVYVLITREKKNSQSIKRAYHAKRVSDSIHTSRNNIIASNCEKKLEACNNKRIEAYILYLKEMQEKYSELFKTTDYLYQQEQKKIRP